MTNPFKRIQEEYDNTLQEIKNAEISNNERSYVNNVDKFMKIKKEASNLYNQMRDDSIPLDIPQLKNSQQSYMQFIPPQYNNAYPQMYTQNNAYLQQSSNFEKTKPIPQTSIFINDLYTGVGDSNLNSVFNVIDNKNDSANMAGRTYLQAPKKPICINSSFSNNVNQSQFLQGNDVVSMQADNGNIYQFNNGNKGGNAPPMCASPHLFNQHLDQKWLPQNAPMLGTITKEQYQQKVSTEYYKQQQARQNNYMNYSNSPLNNPNNPVWKPIDSKYLN